jgi:hypothetical protein
MRTQHWRGCGITGNPVVEIDTVVTGGAEGVGHLLTLPVCHGGLDVRSE